MFVFHSKENQEKKLGRVGLVISNTKVKEIVDLDAMSLKNSRIPLLVFENNQELTLGWENKTDRLKTQILEFRYNGAKQFFGKMIFSITAKFSNFSSCLSGIYQKNRSQENPWYFFFTDHLVFEGSFSDFPDLVSSMVVRVSIRNVISIRKTELFPTNFLTEVEYLMEIGIQNSEHVTIPKFYLDNIYKSGTDVQNSLSLSIEIPNVQQHSLMSKNLFRLTKLNHVTINDELRSILNSKSKESSCESFCVSANGIEQRCIQLNESEKIPCGICVKNIAGSSNLEKLLEKVCAITPATTRVSLSTKRDTSSDTTASTTVGAQRINGSDLFTNCPVERLKFAAGITIDFCHCESQEMGFTGRIEEFFVLCCQTTLNPLKGVNCSNNSSSEATETSIMNECMSYMGKLLSLCYYPAKDSQQSSNYPPPVVNATLPKVVVETTNDLSTFSSDSQAYDYCQTETILEPNGVQKFCNCESANATSKTFAQCCEKYFGKIKDCMMGKNKTEDNGQKGDCSPDGRWRQRCSMSSRSCFHNGLILSTILSISISEKIILL
ncbi:uncharacterized protein LOC142338683 isoform X1 [Convolutriloba macropyga]|uniref:uncharacterized protein LOC142338683 isoform X1 n=1 Tax=Convolutriloba macropyga TaxID=536237 RepID=UPI003F527294